MTNPARPGWSWPASQVTRIVDGDTIDALVTRDLGFGGSATFTVRLRLNRINTPPVGTARGKAAAAHLARLVVDQSVHIETLKPYKYGGPDASPGAWMAEVVNAAGVNVADDLVLHGLAASWDGSGVRPGEVA